jgi:hypothetical protein
VGNRLCPKTDNDDINYEKKRNLLKPFFTGWGIVLSKRTTFSDTHPLLQEIPLSDSSDLQSKLVVLINQVSSYF